MAIRDTLSSLVARPAARVVEVPLRELVQEILAARSFAAPEDVAAVRRELEALKSAGSPVTGEGQARIEALEGDIASLKKKLSMAMGALQAATAQLADARRVAEEAIATARQATQQATSALATAEAAVDGAQGVETALVDRTRPSSSAQADDEEDRCVVPACMGKHRAKGFCAKHYQQWKRGTLEGFVNADGSVELADGTRWKVGTELAGGLAVAIEGRLHVRGQAVEAERA